jgi:DNA-binding Xre family transcriptional regulator
MNVKLIEERRVAAGLTISELAQRVGLPVEALSCLHESGERERITLGTLLALCHVLHLEPTELLDPYASDATDVADARKVHAAIAESPSGLTAEEIATALGWTLPHVRAALAAAAAELRSTGLRLRRGQFDRLTVGPDLSALTADERSRCRQAHPTAQGHHRAMVKALYCIAAGYGRTEFFVRCPERDGNLVELLVGLGLTVENGRCLDLSDDVVFSLRLDEP